MDNITIAGTERSPEIIFDFGANKFSMRGMSYLENAAKFFDPLLEKLQAHLDAQDDAWIDFEFELTYFNSSSARVLLRLFNLLDEIAEKGNKVTLNWIFEAEDDNLEELGEELGEDLEHAELVMRPIDEDD